ncbi:predicted protein [Botrytis cinerea T4]|uniref:Uncharacterized protein n=1 Tax=Botryotinia fuckeliana (strain T4) TaxID=999810 RepID=G2YZB5_BOTF4|nr:predicted protein [Botrytis cinerea T4]
MVANPFVLRAVEEESFGDSQNYFTPGKDTSWLLDALFLIEWRVSPHVRGLNVVISLVTGLADRRFFDYLQRSSTKLS